MDFLSPFYPASFFPGLYTLALLVLFSRQLVLLTALQLCPHLIPTIYSGVFFQRQTVVLVPFFPTHFIASPFISFCRLFPPFTPIPIFLHFFISPGTFSSVGIFPFPVSTLGLYFPPPSPHLLGNSPRALVTKTVCAPGALGLLQSLFGSSFEGFSRRVPFRGHRTFGQL